MSMPRGGAEVPLRVEVDGEDCPLGFRRDDSRQIGGQRRLPDAAAAGFAGHVRFG